VSMSKMTLSASEEESRSTGSGSLSKVNDVRVG